MGTSLNGLTPAGTYPGLIKTGDNAPIDGTLKTLSDGNGNNLPMSVSTTTINLTGTAQVGGVAIANTTQLAAKQDTLVSGTNIKTINGTSLLGSGNIPVVTSPSGIAGAIQFSDGSAFASDAANLFWDDTNNRLGVGTNSPSSKIAIVDDSLVQSIFGIKTSQSASTFQIYNSNSTTTPVWNIGVGSPDTRLIMYDSMYFRINGTQIAEFTSSEVRVGGATGARVGIKGSGSTSATTSLLVQNSAGNTAVQVYDDGKVNINQLVFGGNNGYIGINNSPSIDTALRNVRADNGTSPLSISTGEVGVGDTTTYASAIFAIGSTTRGFLPPRMTTTQKNAIASPAAGLVVYDSTTNKLCCYNGSTWNDLF